MINFYDLSNATLVTLFGMFALWAAASKRHWFIRTAVVASAILVTLLIPAYELVILLSVETLLVVSGMALWRRWRAKSSPAPAAIATPRFRFRLSMETLMLAVVIIAVATAVAARMSALRASDYYYFALDGFMAAQIALTCVWIMWGRIRSWYRALAFPALVFLLAAEYISLRWGGNIVRHWYLTTWHSLRGGSTLEYIKLAQRDFLPATLSWCKPVALGMVSLCIWLWCVRWAGWFDPFGDRSSTELSAPRARRSVLAAHVVAAVLFCIVAIFPLVLLYELMNPTPIPDAPLPDPNGFDDLIAAGNMIGPTAARTLQNSDQLTVDQLRAELAKHQRAFDRMHEGLQRPCRNPYVFQPWPQKNSRSLIYLWDGFWAQGAMARRSNSLTLEQELANNLTLLRLAQEEGRGTGVQYFGGIFNQFEKDGYTGIWSCAPRLSAAKCRELVARLRDIEARRESWDERVAMQRAIDDNSGWEKHFHRIIADWSGEETYKWQRIEDFRRVAQLRILIVKLAIRAYQWKNNDRLPESLEALVPNYIPEVPIDPFGGKKLHYRKSGNKYVLYSRGPDEDDDGGQSRAVEHGEEVGDLTDAALFNLPVFQPNIGPP